MTDFKKFFKEINEQMIFTGTYLEVYIPEDYFKRNIAVMYGNKIKTLGIFNFQIFSSIDNEKKEKRNQSICKIPTEIFMLPSKIEKISEGDENIYILKFYNEDVFLCNTFVEQSISPVETLIKLLNAGKLPASVRYEDALNIFLDNFTLNKFNGNAPASHLEIIISEIYRDSSNPEKSIRFKAAATKGDLKPSDYTLINLKKLSNINSVFTSVTGEDIYQALISSVNKTNDPSSIENVSPIEKTIKY